MTNQEAISVLESINAKTDYFLINDDARAVAIDMAISALQAQDLQSTCNNLATDTISRQAAIDALCRRCDLVAEDDEPCTEKCNDIKILEKLPSAQPEPHWIPVTERLPKNDVEVIVSCTDDSGDTSFSYTTVAWHFKGTWICDNERCFFITAWMPLPEPYRAERRTDE